MRATSDYKKFCIDIEAHECVDQVIAWEINEKIKTYYFRVWVLPQIVKKYPREDVHKLIVSKLKNSIEFYEKKREEYFTEYEQMADAGTPFKERKVWLDSQRAKLDALEGLINDCHAHLETLRINPYHQWIEPGDDERLERDGLEEFINYKYRMCNNIFN